MLKGVMDGYDSDEDDKYNKGKYKMFDIDNDTLGTIWDSHFLRRYDDGKDGKMTYKDFQIVFLNKDDTNEDGTWKNWLTEDDDKNQKVAAEDNDKNKKKRRRGSPSKRGTPKKTNTPTKKTKKH
jgi:hypothetical protein